LKVLNFIKLQRASGGGDVPEAVHAALQTALDSLHWSDTARTRILFLITDAPPHDETKDKLFQLIQRAAAKGIRIVPVICKGADKSTEFIMRSMALATNGTYVFLTDDNAAQFVTKPAVGVFDVQFLNAMLERIIKQMVLANDCKVQNETEISKNIPANIDSVRVNINPAKGTVTIESTEHLKEVFISDFTGKILEHLETKEKQTKWIVDVKSYSNATYLVKYITADDQWGAEKFVLVH
ncbi:MAG TPA: T9SS type A sorting domain-containing protein, partial [Chitinophagaceae bacterium]